MTGSLPGEDLIRAGIADLACGAETVASLLVSIGRSAASADRVWDLEDDASPEERLYLLLARDDPDSAHGHYNALIRPLVSFERAAEAQPGKRSTPARVHAGPPGKSLS